MESTLQLIGIGESLLNNTLVAKEIRSSTDNWAVLKLRSFSTAKETLSVEEAAN